MKKHDEIEERAKYLVSCFSDKDGKGSVLCICPEKKCSWPECQCVTYEPPMSHKLTIELVPQTCWYSNVRSNVSKEQWDVIRRKCYAKAGHKCEVCGDTGKNQGVAHTVECHEIWQYLWATKTQKLVGMIALCPRCHKVKHPGLAQINGESQIVLDQLRKVNGMDREEAMEYIDGAFDEWRKRSEHKWTLDISFLDTYATPSTTPTT